MLTMDASIPSKLLTSPNNTEVIAVKILASNPCRICLLYNPPNSGTDYQDHSLSYVSLLKEKEVPIMIMEDFNSPGQTLIGRDQSIMLFKLPITYSFQQFIFKTPIIPKIIPAIDGNHDHKKEFDMHDFCTVSM